MGGGNAQKSKMAREKNLEKAKAAGKGKSSSSLFLKFPFVVWEYDSENQRKLDFFYVWILIFWNKYLKFSDHKRTTRF